MTCRVTYEIPVDASFFTPVQLQPIVACRIAFNAAARWFGDNLVSPRRLLGDYQTGFVVWSVRVTFPHAARFEDADVLRVSALGKARGEGRQLQCDVTIANQEVVIARIRSISIPILLSGDAALSGTPGKLSQDVLSMFRGDEIGRTARSSPVPHLKSEIRRGGTPLGHAKTPIFVHRYQCEIADQWFWPDAISFAASARESLILERTS